MYDSAFISQFSRSMHVECWDKGVTFLLLTKFDFLFKNNSSYASSTWFTMFQYDQQSLLHEYTCLIQKAMNQIGK